MSASTDKLVFWPSKTLSKQSNIVVTQFTEDLKTLVDEMTALLQEISATGLSACQVGVSKQLFIAAIGEEEKVVVFINPEVMSTSERKVKSLEQCASLPGAEFVLKSRALEITIMAFDLEGNPFQETYTEKDAVIIQHEMDHLRGKTLLSRVGTAQRLLKKKKISKRVGEIRKPRSLGV